MSITREYCVAITSKAQPGAESRVHFDLAADTAFTAAVAFFEGVTLESCTADVSVGRSDGGRAWFAWVRDTKAPDEVTFHQAVAPGYLRFAHLAKEVPTRLSVPLPATATFGTRIVGTNLGNPTPVFVGSLWVPKDDTAPGSDAFFVVITLKFRVRLTGDAERGLAPPA